MNPIVVYCTSREDAAWFMEQTKDMGEIRHVIVDDRGFGRCSVQITIFRPQEIP